MSDEREDDTVHDAARLLAAGHALGSLSPEERESYERLLRSSPDARSEASDFAEVAAALKASPPKADPPADLKARLMAQIAVTPQTPRTAPPDDSPAVTEAERKAQRRWYSRPSVVVAAAAAAVVLFAGGTVVGFAVAQHSQSTVQADTLASITSAPDAQRATAGVTGGGTATLVWAPSVGKSAMIVDGVGTAPAGKTYQLWYIRDGHATSAGLMSGGWQVLQGTLQSGDVVGVTVEPAGGSKQPTTKPVVTIAS
ncbi:hypothetical protein HII28_06780 [Planctomonas sp. JC2975]|uniref:anti-sigma factor n=1 Tax=Planctomonas sp. JC2975 TaxID=2729626 RepID=UPI001474E5D7|nr:anti-sigma factor [Planctomonas sp. JC2975]NNC11581.1 hypothetical protein [Planctomonas sp. JC2975]